MASHPDAHPDSAPAGAPDHPEQVEGGRDGGRESIEDNPGGDNSVAMPAGTADAEDETFER
jgi:hypothetical protein